MAKEAQWESALPQIYDCEKIVDRKRYGCGLPSPPSMGPKAGFKELRPEPQAFKSRAQIDR